jgi:hypothetical protein
MLPAPARIARMPSQSSGASWNPAVPPPPVAGAAVGKELSAGLGDGLGLLLALALLLALGLLLAVALALALLLALALGVAVAVPDAESDGVAWLLAAGENGVGVAEGRPDEQAETAAGATMVKMAQPMVASLALGPVPAMVVRILWGLPHTCGRWLASSIGPASATGPG